MGKRLTTLALGALVVLPGASAPGPDDPVPAGYEWIGTVSFEYDFEYHEKATSEFGVSEDYTGREYMSIALRDGPGDQSHARDVANGDVWTVKADFVVRGRSTETKTWNCTEADPRPTGSSRVVRTRDGRAALTVTIRIGGQVGGFGLTSADLQDVPVTGSRTDELTEKPCKGPDSTRDTSPPVWHVPHYAVLQTATVFPAGRRATQGHVSNDPDLNKSDVKITGPTILNHRVGPWGDTRWDLSLCPPD